MATLAVCSIKGGVGKTTAAVNVAYLAARDGVRTLLCDLDPQGSASFCFRIRPRKGWRARKLVRGGARLSAAIRATDYENLDLLPAHLSFRSLDLLLDRRERSKRRLERLLAPMAGDYPLIVLDCPPGVSLLVESALAAADVVLVPVVPTALSVQAHGTFLEVLRKRGFESKVVAFLSMVDRRKRLHRLTAETLATSAGVVPLSIPYSRHVEEMAVRRAPLPVFGASSEACEVFRRLWQELALRLALPVVDRRPESEYSQAQQDGRSLQ